MPVQQRWKGKERAVPVQLDGRDEGTGGEDGIVLSLTLVGSGVYDAVYTIPVNIGDRNQQFSIQVDTGSSDLWIASTSCSSSSCTQTKGHLYDPNGATQTGVGFSIPYLSGSAAGPIVWDKVTIGKYTIDNQAFAATNNVQNEALAPNFSGVLGLALPLNSIIASDIPPVTDNNPDGAAWASNLFSITPISAIPSSHFLSLALSRPGSDRIPAVFGIGRHPSSLVPDPSLIRYSTVVSDKPGTLFWKVSVKAITVYVNGTARRVQLERSDTGAPFPIAVLDSGVSLILTTSTIANGIYGAIGINPASDGMYYVPCTTPLNMSITLDNRPETPLHPLDLTAEPPQDNRAQFCIGLIQAADSQLSKSGSSLGDIILGVPFLRNVYTVMAYTTPNTDGSFSPVNGTNQTITPRLGLLSLTDPTTALEEFNTVRVLNRPISDGGGSGNSGGGSSSSGNANNLGGKRLSVGIIVLIAILSFFALCCVLFVARWFVFRRKYRKEAAAAAAAAAGMHQTHGDVYGVDKNSTTEVYMLAKTISSKDDRSTIGDDGGYVGLKFETPTVVPGVTEEKIFSDPSMSNDKTKRAVVHNGGDEFGVRTEQVIVGRSREKGAKNIEWESLAVTNGDNTLVQHQQKFNPIEEPDHLHSSLLLSSSSPDPVTFNPPLPSQLATPSHLQSPVLDPLNQMSSPNYDHEIESHEAHGESDDSGTTSNVKTSMAGIGTASRANKIDLDSHFLRDISINRGAIMASAGFGDNELSSNGIPSSLITNSTRT